MEEPIGLDLFDERHDIVREFSGDYRASIARLQIGAIEGQIEFQQIVDVVIFKSKPIDDFRDEIGNSYQ
jgi:hypothetical protein